MCLLCSTAPSGGEESPAVFGTVLETNGQCEYLLDRACACLSYSGWALDVQPTLFSPVMTRSPSLSSRYRNLCVWERQRVTVRERGRTGKEKRCQQQKTVGLSSCTLPPPPPLQNIRSFTSLPHTRSTLYRVGQSVCVVDSEAGLFLQLYG